MKYALFLSAFVTLFMMCLSGIVIGEIYWEGGEPVPEKIVGNWLFFHALVFGLLLTWIYEHSTIFTRNPGDEVLLDRRQLKKMSDLY